MMAEDRALKIHSDLQSAEHVIAGPPIREKYDSGKMKKEKKKNNNITYFFFFFFMCGFAFGSCSLGAPTQDYQICMNAEVNCFADVFPFHCPYK
jgi:hypothetical protein